MFTNYSKAFLIVFLINVSTLQLQSQNLLDFSNWTLGSGNALPFVKYGSNSENNRVNYVNNVNEDIIAWKGEGIVGSGASGGWTTQPIAIDNTKTYMMTVWIKKTTNNEGTSRFGTRSYSSGAYQIRKLTNNATVVNPYFYNDKLPELDKWYLFVAYVHHKDYTSSFSPSAIFDGETGQRVAELTGYKFSSNASLLQHRVQLYNPTSGITDVQYMADPAIYVSDGSEPSLEVLLNSNSGSTLQFAFDNAGSQKQRFYCEEFCTIPPPPDGLIDPDDTTSNDKQVEKEHITDTIDLSISPNPTTGVASIRLIEEGENIFLSHSIVLYNSRGSTLKTIQLGRETRETTIDISSFPAGVYAVHVHLSNGEAITKQLIKK